MVAQRYTAHEIVQVIAAGKDSQAQETTDVPPQKPVKSPAFGPG
jgi:hypothetical protein